MAALDNLINRMVSREVNRVVLEGDRPMKLYKAGSLSEGPVVTTVDINAMLTEAAPPLMKATILMKGRSAFVHRSPHGQFNVSSIRGKNGVVVSISSFTDAQVRMIGVALALGGILGTAVLMSVSHSMVDRSGKYFPALVALGPATIVMGLIMAATGKQPNSNRAEMESADYVFYGLALLAGFIAYSLFKNGVI